MLILTRYADQEILIGPDIRVVVVGVRPSDGRVKLGIDAPRSVAVDRREVRDSKDANRRQYGQFQAGSEARRC